MNASAPPGRAYLIAHWHGGDSDPIPVQYNPGELTFEKKLVFAEVAIPGLTAPLQQFVRGEGEILSIELFFDTSDKGMSTQAESVTAETDKIYSLARIEPSGHAPPPVTFYWGKGFPGANVSDELDNQKRESFTGIITSIRQNFTLFSSGGVPLRAKLTLSVREYKTLSEQLDELNLSSPDRTHGHVLATGDQLWSVANKYYSRPAEWRRVADANAIADPRRIHAGTRLAVPSIDRGRLGR
jgi:nucleoid-associated protein YgaU